MDILLSAFDRSFTETDRRSRSLLSLLSDDELFVKPREIVCSMGMFSCGEYILRSAAVIEKTFGGITTRLWDDPFEWTLPEKLSTVESVFQYLDDVETTRTLGFAYFKSDIDLTRQIPAPEKLTPIIDILLATQSMAEHFQGRAFAVFQMISNKKLPRV